MARKVAVLMHVFNKHVEGQARELIAPIMLYSSKVTTAAESVRICFAMVLVSHLLQLMPKPLRLVATWLGMSTLSPILWKFYETFTFCLCNSTYAVCKCLNSQHIEWDNILGSYIVYQQVAILLFCSTQLCLS